MNTIPRGPSSHDATGRADVRIEAVPAPSREEALAFLLTSVKTARVRNVVQPAPIDADAERARDAPLATARQPAAGEELLYWARSGEQLVGVTWAQPTSRVTVTIVPPRLDPFAPREIGQRLLASLLAAVAEQGGGRPRCAVALVDDEDQRTSKPMGTPREWLSVARFEQVTIVEFMLATAPSSDLTPAEPAPSITLRRAGRDDAEQFAQTLRMTTAAGAEDSEWARWRQAAKLDLEEDDVETSGAGECYFVQHETRVVGVLVLTPAEVNEPACEIRYLGIFPAERRRGYAVQTLRAVRQLAARRGQSVIASVDSSQTAAVRAYLRAGFQPGYRRELWAKRIDAV